MGNKWRYICEGGSTILLLLRRDHFMVSLGRRDYNNGVSM